LQKNHRVNSRGYQTIYRGPGFLLPAIRSTGDPREDRRGGEMAGEGEKGGWQGAESYNRKKAWSSITHLILLGINPLRFL